MGGEEKYKVYAPYITPKVSKVNKWHSLTSAVGSCTGIVATDGIALDGSSVKPGDVILGLSSNGLHITGFDLVRKAFLPEGENQSEEWHADQMNRVLKAHTESSYDEDKEELTTSGIIFEEELLKPTIAYLDLLRIVAIAKFAPPTLIANIGEGGFLNLLNNKASKVKFSITSLPTIPRVYRLIREKLGAHVYEMFINFNMGIGMCVVIPKEEEATYLTHIERLPFNATVIGRVEASPIVTVTIQDEELKWGN